MREELENKEQCDSITRNWHFLQSVRSAQTAGRTAKAQPITFSDWLRFGGPPCRLCRTYRLQEMPVSCYRVALFFVFEFFSHLASPCMVALTSKSASALSMCALKSTPRSENSLGLVADIGTSPFGNPSEECSPVDPYQFAPCARILGDILWGWAGSLLQWSE